MFLGGLVSGGSFIFIGLTLANEKSTVVPEWWTVASLIDLARAPGPQKYVFIGTRISKKGRPFKTNNTYSDFGFQLRLAARDVLSSLDSLPHLSIYRHPIGSSKHRAGTKESQRIVFSASIINCDIPEHVLANFLRQVNVDTKEIGYRYDFVTNFLMDKKDTYDPPEQPQLPGVDSGTNQRKGHHDKPRKIQHAEECQGFPSFVCTRCVWGWMQMA